MSNQIKGPVHNNCKKKREGWRKVMVGRLWVFLILVEIRTPNVILEWAKKKKINENKIIKINKAET